MAGTCFYSSLALVLGILCSLLSGEQKKDIGIVQTDANIIYFVCNKPVVYFSKVRPRYMPSTLFAKPAMVDIV